MEGNNSKIFFEIQSNSELRKKFREYTSASPDERKRYKFFRNDANNLVIVNGKEIDELIAKLTERLKSVGALKNI